MGSSYSCRLQVEELEGRIVPASPGPFMPFPAAIVSSNLVVEVATPGVTTPVVVATTQLPPLSPRSSTSLREWTAYHIGAAAGFHGVW